MIAALARPLGILVFGYLSDVYGRRFALLSSMTGIALATLIIGILPAYQQIGVAASLSNILKIYPRELLAGFFIGGFATLPFTTVIALLILC